ncbi:MAG TPA: DUF58 domain-containing protein [Polyangiaceae bacterium]|nr:DUF58 domain-containing protein [Polyangiaceae bacterium]
MANIRQARIDWGQLASLKLRARTVADGVLSSVHRSNRHGAGVEFGGHRDYVPGDDLRFLDRRVLMRHGKLIVRLFETETERALNLVVDATGSMGYQSAQAQESKLSFAALLAAALARVALREGDIVSLDWLAGERCHPMAPMGGAATFDRLIDALENVQSSHGESIDGPRFEGLVDRLDRRGRRGAVVVFISDLLDLPERAADGFARLASRGRVPIALRVLDPMERNFSFKGPVRLRASEAPLIVETDPEQVRERYLAALRASKDRWSEPLLAVGGQVVDCTTTDDPVQVLLAVLQAAMGKLP